MIGSDGASRGGDAAGAGPVGAVERITVVEAIRQAGGGLVWAAAMKFASDSFDDESDAGRLPPALQRAAPKRRREYLAGRCCAALALARAGAGWQWPDRGDDGLPAWPPGWVGSLSHTMESAIAVVAPAASQRVLGIDEEQLLDGARADEIRELVVLPGECDLLAGHDAGLALTLLFSAKEALYKALYPGTREFRDFGAARLVGHQGSRLLLELTLDWGGAWTRGVRLPVNYWIGDGLVTTLVAAGT